MLIAIDCEGPLTKNDNALELSRHFIPDGERLFTQLSRYDDILAYMLKRPGYRPGNTLKLICPFFKAFGVDNQAIKDFSSAHLLVMPGAGSFLRWITEQTDGFIISTSYRQYIQTLCEATGFPVQNTFSTNLDMDFLDTQEEEALKVRAMAARIVNLPLMDWPSDIRSIDGFSDDTRSAFYAIDRIMTTELEELIIGEYLKQVEPVGGTEKAKAVGECCRRTGQQISSVIYIGDSITDVDAFRMVREGGGMTVSFNGNRYAVEAAEMACIAHHSNILAVICQVFSEQGSRGVAEMVRIWAEGHAFDKKTLSPSSLAASGMHGEEMLRYFWGKNGLSYSQFEAELLANEKKHPSYLSMITDENRLDIIELSERFRLRVRGEEIGRLG